MTKEELEERCCHWQKVLRLQDWSVDIKILRHFDMTREHCMAYVEVFEPKKHAHINFKRPDDEDPKGWPQEPMEYSLVHELVHLHLWPFNPEQDTPQWTAMEQAVHSLTRALMALEQSRGTE